MKRIWPTLLAAVLLAACSKNGSPTGPTDPAPSSFAGTWSGTYTVTACTQSGGVADLGFCAQFGSQTAAVSFVLTQDGQAVSGSFRLGSLAFSSSSATVGGDGRVSLAGQLQDGFFSINASWNVGHASPTTLTGQTRQVWTLAGATGEGVLEGQIASVTKTQ